MSLYTIRPLTIADAPAAAKLWSLVFGDEEALILEFFRLFAHTPHFGICAEQDGQIAAAAYCPQGTNYISPDGTEFHGAYLYAVATHPDHRKQGLAAKLCRQLKEQVFAHSKAYLFTRPSEESLFPWYEEKIGAVPMLGMDSLHFVRHETKPLPVTELTAEAYVQLRKKHLRGLPHVSHDASWMEWEHLLHGAYGGAFCEVGDFIADYFSDGSTLQINELLPHPTAEQAEAVAQALMTATGTAQCTCALLGTGHYVSVVSPDGSKPSGWFGVCYG